jgi:hypothetical protein
VTDVSTSLAEYALWKKPSTILQFAVQETFWSGLLARGFVEFASSGRTYHRDELIARSVEENDHAAQAQSELLAREYVLTFISADAVLLTYQTQHKESAGSQRHVLRSSIWKYADGRWQMLFHQGTLAQPAA